MYMNNQSERQGKAKQLRLKKKLFRKKREKALLFLKRKEELLLVGLKPATFCHR